MRSQRAPHDDFGHGARGGNERSFLSEHGGGILAAIIIAVATAAIIGGWGPLRTAACDRFDLPTCPATLPDAYVGRWAFVRHEPGPPPSTFGFVFEPLSLRFTDDGEYSLLYNVILPGAEPSQMQYSGGYQVQEVQGAQVTVDFESPEDGRLLGTSVLSVTGGELRRLDIDSGITDVYVRT